MNELCSTAPDYMFIDCILLAYRLGRVRYPEQAKALMAAARTATDAISFATAGAVLSSPEAVLEEAGGARPPPPPPRPPVRVPGRAGAQDEAWMDGRGG